jgi:hypothetical protein
MINISEWNEKTRNAKLIFHLNYGSYFGGYLEFVIYRNNGDFIMEVGGMNGVHLEWHFAIPESAIDAVAKSALPVKKWETEYYNPGVMDGYEWEIQLNWKECHIKSKGYEKYPEDYESVLKSLQNAIQEIHDRYSDEKSKIPNIG